VATIAGGRGPSTYTIALVLVDEARGAAPPPWRHGDVDRATEQIEQPLAAFTGSSARSRPRGGVRA
jgi:hypothetical protein